MPQHQQEAAGVAKRRPVLILAVALALIAQTSDAFVIRPLSTGALTAPTRARASLASADGRSSVGVQQTASGGRRRSQVARMLVEPQGSDAFDDLEAEAEGNPLRKALRKLGPSTAKAVSTGLIPAAAVVGFLITPGGKVVSAVGAAVTGLAGTLAKRKLGDESKAAAPAAVAELLQSKGLTNVRPADITAVLATYGVQGDEASDLLIDVYRRFLLAMCKGSATKAADIRELRDLRQALGLDGEQIGTAHYEASTLLYRERVLFTPEEELADEYNPARRALDKFLFLADRMFEVSDTEEAYEYEMGRIRKVFGLDAADVNARCLAIARPFYAKALDAAAARLDTLRPGALELAEKTLGITDVMRDEMHLEAYRAEARALLEGTKLKDGAVERLGKLGNALKLDEEQQRQELEAVTVPVYEAAVARELEQALEATNEDPDTARRQSALRSGRLASMQLGLSLSADTSARVLQSSVRNAASTHFIAAAKFVRVGNNAKALEAAKELVAFVKAASGLVEKAFGLEEGEDPVRKIFQGSMVDDLSRKEGGQLYRIYLNAALAGQTALTDEQAADLKTLARLMGQGASEVQRAYQEATGPLLRKALEDSIEDGGYGADAKARNEALVKGLGIPKAVVSEQLKDLYFQRLKAVAGYGTIMTQAQRDDLHKLQDFLGLDQDTVDGLHRLVCAPAYQQSILESMGAAGVITPELRDALEVLRKRLGLTQSHARELLHAAARAKMKPMVEQLCYEFERTYLSKEQLAQRRGRDQGDDVLVSGNDAGDLGIVTTGAVNSDTLALVDFYLDNELPVVENGVTYYPVTAEGLGPAPLLERLYQQFVVAAFGVEGETAARYQAAQAPLAGILGIPREKVSSVHAEIGSTVLNQFFTAQLARGATSLGARETAFLASIGSKLGLPDAEYDALVTSVKRRVLTYKAETAFQKPVFSVEMARNLRETAAGLGLELSRDVGLSQERLKKLFVTEAGAALEGEGEGGVEEIEEVAEACGLGEDEAQAILGGMLRERAEAAIKDAASDVKASRDARVVASVTRLLSYCRLAGGLEVELRLADHVCESIYGTYMASRTASNEEEEAKLQEDGAMLRTVLGLKQPVSA